MFGGLLTQKCVKELQADQSALGARRSIAPTKKTTLFLVDVMACLTIQFGEICITIIYLAGILKVNMGGNIGYVLLTALAGGLAGNGLGLFVALVAKGSPETREGWVTGISLVSSFLAGLMWMDMYRIVEKHAPIINRINPASLIVNSFYSLIIYDTKDRYFENLLSLLVIFAVTTVASIVIIRRKKYASI
jgi:ABC-2 type transport system permease protein